jgi:hypothetical protein
MACSISSLDRERVKLVKLAGGGRLHAKWQLPVGVLFVEQRIFVPDGRFLGGDGLFTSVKKDNVDPANFIEPMRYSW